MEELIEEVNNMSAEINWRHVATGDTLYATIRSRTNTMWSTAGTPNFEALTVANWANYAITMTETPASSYFYVGTFPAISGNMVAGFYWVDIYKRLAGSVAISDTIVGGIVGYWDGATFAPWDANLKQVLGTLLTETSAGYLAAGIKKVFDVASPVFTAASVNQTGDVGVAGAGLTALGDTRLANLDATVSSRLAPAGTLATVTNVTNAITLPSAAYVHSAGYVGNVVEDSTFYFFFTTTKANGVLTTIGGSTGIAVYINETTGGWGIGINLELDHNSKTGLHRVKIDTSADARFVPGDYTVILTSGTVDGNSIVGSIVGEFSIGNTNRYPTITNIQNGLATPTNITAASGVQLASSQHVIVDSGTVTNVTNAVDANVTKWLGVTPLALSSQRVQASSTDALAILAGTVNTVSSNDDFTLTSTDLTTNNDDYNGMWLIFTSGNNKGVPRIISDYIGSIKNVLFAGTGRSGAFPQTVAPGDTFLIMAGIP